jgi:hypothetical protein
MFSVLDQHQPPRLPKAGQSRPPDRATAWGFALTNLVLPGLGTLLAGHRLAGILQLIISQTGFVLMLLWAVSYVRNWIETGSLPEEFGPRYGLSLFGMTLFLLALFASAASSLQILRDARRTKA